MVAMTDPDVHRLEQEVLRLQRQLQEVQERTANHVALLQQQLANKAQHIEVESFHNEQRLLKTDHLSHLFVRDFRPRSSPSRTTRRSRPSSGSTQTHPLLRESAGIWVSLLFIFQDSSSAGAHYRWSLGERNTLSCLWPWSTKPVMRVETEIYTSSENWVYYISIDVWFVMIGQYLKIWGCNFWENHLLNCSNEVLSNAY